MIRGRPTKPLYQVVEDHIRELIDGGTLVPGDLIPSEPQLAKQLDVSQGTVKKAIDNLVWERRLFRHQGKGTYVSNIDFNNSLPESIRRRPLGDSSGHRRRCARSCRYRATSACCSSSGSGSSGTNL